MPPNAADRKSIRAAEKAARQTEVARQEIVTQIMSTSPGRAYLWAILERCHIFTPSFTTDPLMTAFAEGERSIGLNFLADIMAVCPDQYVQAAREANDRHHSNDRSASDELTRSEDPRGYLEGSDHALDYDIYSDRPSTDHDRSQA